MLLQSDMQSASALESTCDVPSQQAVKEPAAVRGAESAQGLQLVRSALMTKDTAPCRRFSCLVPTLLALLHTS